MSTNLIDEMMGNKNLKKKSLSRTFNFERKRMQLITVWVECSKKKKTRNMTMYNTTVWYVFNTINIWNMCIILFQYKDMIKSV